MVRGMVLIVLGKTHAITILEIRRAHYQHLIQAISMITMVIDHTMIGEPVNGTHAARATVHKMDCHHRPDLKSR